MAEYDTFWESPQPQCPQEIAAPYLALRVSRGPTSDACLVINGFPMRCDPCLSEARMFAPAKLALGECGALGAWIAGWVGGASQGCRGTFGLRSGYVIGLEASGGDKYYVLFGVLETPSGLSPHAAWSVRWLVFTSAFGGWLRDLVVALNRPALRCEPSVGGLSRGKPQANGTVERVRRKS